MYSPLSSPYSHALVGSGFTEYADADNGLALIHYEDNIYSKTKIINYLALGIFIGSLFVYVLSLFFRKMIGV